LLTLAMCMGGPKNRHRAWNTAGAKPDTSIGTPKKLTTFAQDAAKKIK